MRRRMKQILYGAMYIVLFAFIVWSAYQTWLKPIPSCVDGVRNQGEFQVDCGGPCASCDLTDLSELELRDVEFYQLASGDTALVAKIYNPNTDHKAVFSYEFTILSRGEFIAVRSGLSEIRGGASVWIYQTVSLDERVTDVTLTFSDTSLERTDLVLQPKLEVVHIETVREGSTVTVYGTIRNQSVVIVPSVWVTAFFYNTTGYRIFASRTILQNVPAFGERTFTIHTPTDELFADAVDINATSVVTHLKQ